MLLDAEKESQKPFAAGAWVTTQLVKNSVRAHQWSIPWCCTDMRALMPGVLHIQNSPETHTCLRVSHQNLKSVSVCFLSLLKSFSENIGFGDRALIGFRNSDLC